MKRILVPIDGSAYSVDALKYVAERRRHGEKFDLVVLNVQPYVTASPYFAPAMIKRWQEEQTQEALGRPGVQSLINRLKAKIAVVVGEPAMAIVHQARKSKCDEIVMATRGLGGIKGAVLGSVAHKVVHLSSLPVTLVK